MFGFFYLLNLAVVQQTVPTSVIGALDLRRQCCVAG